MVRAGAALSFAAVVAITVAALPYREGPPPAHTGGFNEPTCASCHFDTPDADSVQIGIRGLPERYTPGGVYDVDLTVTGEAVAAGGFQLAIRFADTGVQAGTLAAADGRVRIVAERGVQYAQHAALSTVPGGDTLRWRLQWTAPAAGTAAVLHLAVNAANDDDSPFGDVVALRTLRISGEK